MILLETCEINTSITSKFNPTFNVNATHLSLIDWLSEVIHHKGSKQAIDNRNFIEIFYQTHGRQKKTTLLQNIYVSPNTPQINASTNKHLAKSQG